MIKICFYDTKPYDKVYFDLYKDNYEFQIDYFETKLNSSTAILANGYEAVETPISSRSIVVLHGNTISARRAAGVHQCS
jgi:D-lactate dehydrogenase